MKLKDLQAPLTELPAGRAFFRVPLLRAVVDAARRSGVPLLAEDASV
ncbi:hypothetical protein [Hydrogenophaga sp. SL48]|jgi:hypothetical protein|nr:hypothetical protein [Hydrogenophaga sp. SL48]UJW78834.1 hypothetical protein IM738_12955 [Hydrogenophaga sp. SL48]